MSENKRYLYNFIVILSCLMILLFPYFVEAKQDSDKLDEKKHIIILLVPGLSFEELDYLISNSSNPQLWKTGVYSAVNLKPEGSTSYLNNMVSLATGKRAVGVLDWNAYEKGEMLDKTPLDNLFLQWHGKKARSSLIHPYYHLLKSKNDETSFSANVGWLGRLLEDEGVFTYVLGNSDSREEKTRFASLFVMNELGEANGEISSILVDNVSEPVGKKTDHRKILDKILGIQLEQEKTLTVIEWGDLYRFFEEQPKMDTTHQLYQYEKTLKRLDDTIQEAFQLTGAELWLLSPYVNSNAYKRRNQLGPLWIWKEDRTQKELLYSDTTRRLSLVSNTDIAITLADSFKNSEPIIADSLGRPLQFVDNQDDWSVSSFQRRLEEINHVYSKRGAVLSSYVSGLVVMLIVVSLMIWLLDEKVRWRRIAEILLLSGVLSPWLYLITSPWVLLFSAFSYVVIILGSSFLLAALLRRFTKHPFSVACFVFFVTLTLDVALHSYLIERSFLSYDPVIGARYYGIGNEYAGVFIVSGILMMAPWIRLEFIQKKSELFYKLAPVLLLLVVVLGTSKLGANAGASLSTGIILVFLTYQLFLKKKKWMINVAIMGGIFISLLAGLYVLQRAQPASHIYVAFDQLLSGEFGTIWNTIQRKVQMNWKIFKISYWTQLFITSYFFIGLVLWNRKKDQLSDTQSFLIYCCIVGSLALLVLNDSGIVAAATSMFVTLSVCYGWSLEKRANKEGAEKV
ncbi:hypothetical protein ACERII_14405 [Evansella sp. AB-rgal1]|uniref:hypothetical protein n=1 Tax=Evansella sp. AB-rgal1 TaxID=3242696 RepID=UPI00359DE884